MPSDTRRPAASWASADDLTPRARVRNAAFELHASQGEANTTLREVAEAAGLTHGVVLHHFTSKDGLRRAVQQHMLDPLSQAIDDVPTEGTAPEIGRARDASVARMYAEHPAWLAYVRRALIDPRQLDTELRRVIIGHFSLTRHETHGGQRRYGGSTARWGFAVYLASKNGYQDSVLPSGHTAGPPADALDTAHGLYLNDPTAWT
jgi:AcrR family transcriptional regulator